MRIPTRLVLASAAALICLFGLLIGFQLMPYFQDNVGRPHLIFHRQLLPNQLPISLRLEILALYLIFFGSSIYSIICIGKGKLDEKGALPRIFAYLLIAGAGFSALFAYLPLPVSESSREKLVINNLHQLASVGQQYCQREQVDSVTYHQLVRKKYLTPLVPAYGETYFQLVVEKDGGVLQAESAIGPFTFGYGDQRQTFSSPTSRKQ